VVLFTNEHISPLRFTACTLLTALAVNRLSDCGERMRSALASPALLWLGTLSFSLYVWQQLFFIFAHNSPVPMLCMVLMLGFALGSYKLVENPAREYLNSRWRPRESGQARTPWAVRT
jgi:peptidoglycan/LPS O-acetylase OafA/YrhL